MESPEAETTPDDTTPDDTTPADTTPTDEHTHGDHTHTHYPDIYDDYYSTYYPNGNFDKHNKDTDTATTDTAAGDDAATDTPAEEDEEGEMMSSGMIYGEPAETTPTYSHGHTYDTDGDLSISESESEDEEEDDEEEESGAHGHTEMTSEPVFETADDYFAFYYPDEHAYTGTGDDDEGDMMASDMMSGDDKPEPSPYTAGSYYDVNIVDDHDAYFAKYYPDSNFDKHVMGSGMMSGAAP